MSLFVGILAEHIQDAVNDPDTSREEWEQALNQVFGKPVVRAVETGSGSHRLTWTIDQEANSSQTAAAEVWRRVFGRSGQPSPDEACVFTASQSDGSTVEIDLSDRELADLFI